MKIAVAKDGYGGRCEQCGTPSIRGRRFKYCSDACKQEQYRSRKQGGGAGTGDLFNQID